MFVCLYVCMYVCRCKYMHVRFVCIFLKNVCMLYINLNKMTHSAYNHTVHVCM